MENDLSGKEFERSRGFARIFAGEMTTHDEMRARVFHCATSPAFVHNPGAFRSSTPRHIWACATHCVAQVPDVFVARSASWLPRPSITHNAASCTEYAAAYRPRPERDSSPRTPTGAARSSRQRGVEQDLSEHSGSTLSSHSAKR